METATACEASQLPSGAANNLTPQSGSSLPKPDQLGEDSKIETAAACEASQAPCKAAGEASLQSDSCLLQPEQPGKDSKDAGPQPLLKPPVSASASDMNQCQTPVKQLLPVDVQAGAGIRSVIREAVTRSGTSRILTDLLDKETSQLQGAVSQAVADAQTAKPAFCARAEELLGEHSESGSHLAKDQTCHLACLVSMAGMLVKKHCLTTGIAAEDEDAAMYGAFLQQAAGMHGIKSALGRLRGHLEEEFEDGWHLYANSMVPDASLHPDHAEAATATAAAALAEGLGSVQAHSALAGECVALMHLLAYTHDAAGREKAIFDWRCYRSKKMIVWVSSHIGSSFMDARRQLNG